jgi:hypothetical protein
MSKANAAKLWARLERFLIERCGLPDGRMLDVARAEIIRMLGKVPPHDRAEKLSSVGRAQVKRKLDELCGDDEGGIIPPPKGMEIDRTPQPWWNSDAPKVRKVRKSTCAVAQNCAPDTIHDPKLAAMLDRACSGRGYDGDDEVSYER